MFEQLRRRMADRRRQRAADAAQRADEQSRQSYEKALARWSEQRSAAAHLVDVATNFTGTTTDELMLKSGEAVFASISNASLMGEHKGAGHWEGRSSGVSIPIGSLGGRTVRYHVGATRGHYVQGAPVAAALDTGTFFVTNQRAVFVGAKRTSECAFSKLVAYRHDDSTGTTTLSVSNREKPTVVAYGAKIAGWVDFRFDLALAHFRGEVPTLVQGLQRSLAEVDASKPTAPEPAPPEAVGSAAASVPPATDPDSVPARPAGGSDAVPAPPAAGSVGPQSPPPPPPPAGSTGPESSPLAAGSVGSESPPPPEFPPAPPPEFPPAPPTT